MPREYYQRDARVDPETFVGLRKEDVVEWPPIAVSEQRISTDVFETLQADWIESIRRSNAADR